MGGLSGLETHLARTPAHQSTHSSQPGHAGSTVPWSHSRLELGPGRKSGDHSEVRAGRYEDIPPYHGCTNLFEEGSQEDGHPFHLDLYRFNALQHLRKPHAGQEAPGARVIEEEGKGACRGCGRWLCQSLQGEGGESQLAFHKEQTICPKVETIVDIEAREVKRLFETSWEDLLAR